VPARFTWRGSGPRCRPITPAGSAGRSLPELEKLPTPTQFAGLFDDINQLERKRLKAGKKLKKLCGRLKGAGIEAIGPATTEAPDTEKPEALKQKVLKRAEVIRTRGQDIPAPPEARSVVPADAEDEAGEEEDEESHEAA
jgi:hypothetical protein